MARPRTTRRRDTEENADVGFQIAPMIDVVFVVLVFFMSLTGAIKLEAELNTKLPGTAVTSESVEFPDEQVIAVAATGQLSLNDDPIPVDEGRDLAVLLNSMMRIKANADAAKTRVLVTIASDAEAPYYRTIDVLNALAAASIDNVTFTVQDEL
jgi:biopolymer transport protein ExbD